MSARKKNEDRRRGVALIVVLGFLSLMVMMAVAFLTQARVERMVASSSMEGMRTRQMAQTAMAAAMQDYLNAMKQTTPADAATDVFLSGDLPVTLKFHYSNQTIGDDRLVIGKVEDWLLDEHLDAAMGGGEASDDIRNAEWIWIREEPGELSRILGRYAYACFNMSGLVDAHLLGSDYGDDVPEYGSTTNRNSARRMLFDAVAATPGTGGARQLKLNQYQYMWKGFDTPAALRNLTDGKVNDGQPGAPNRWEGVNIDEAAVGGIAVDDLAPYSYSVIHRADGSGKEKIQATAAKIFADPEFSGDILAGADPENVKKALADYEDSDSWPQGGVPDYPSVEPVPMFNEMGVRIGLVETAAGTDTNGMAVSTYAMQVHVKPEFWFPFPSDLNPTAAFSFAPTIGGDRNLGGGAEIWVLLAGRDSGGNAIDLMANVPTPFPPKIVNAVKGGPDLPGTDGGGEYVFTVPLTDVNGVAKLSAGMALRIGNIRIQNLNLKDNAQTVDAMAIDEPLDFFFRPAAVLLDGETTDMKSAEVNDPRLNHLADSWFKSDVNPPSFGDTNATAKAAINQVVGIDPGEFFFCRNDRMKCPAELGYLPAAKPWETLNVFGNDGIRFMNRLVCDDEIYNLLQSQGAYFTNGTINPYTRRTNVLNAAFYGLDFREVPAMPGKPKDDEHLSAGDLKPIVKAIMDMQVKNGPAGWGAVLGDSGVVPGLNKNHLIALMCDTWGLFNESDQLFVVVVVAQSIKESDDPSGEGNWNAGEDVVTGERRAVALCWLDGSSDVGGETLTQEMNVIMFQYLNE